MIIDMQVRELTLELLGADDAISASITVEGIPGEVRAPRAAPSLPVFRNRTRQRPNAAPDLWPQFPAAAANAVILIITTLMIIFAMTKLVDIRKEL